MDALVTPVEAIGPSSAAGPAGLSSPIIRAGPDKGFTMIELAVALAVIGIGLAIGLGSYSDWRESHRFSSAVSTVDNALRTARLKAIGRQQSLDVVFEPKTETELQADGWIGASSGGIIVRYPYRASPADAADYGKMALVYDPGQFNVHVDTGPGIVALGDEAFTSSTGSCELLSGTTDEWKRTEKFNSRGMSLRRTNDITDLTQLPFRFLIKTPPTSSHKQGVIFSVSPQGKITRTMADPSLLESE